MNKRIRALNLQAISAVMNGADPDGDVERMYIPSEFTKKFAELVVRECLSNMQNCDGDLDFAIWKTKKDFEVEE